MTLLRVENLTARYGASQALFGVDFTLAEGEVLALMGRNGMGKTTTVKGHLPDDPVAGQAGIFRPKPACSSQFPCRAPWPWAGAGRAALFLPA